MDNWLNLSTFLTILMKGEGSFTQQTQLRECTARSKKVTETKEAFTSDQVLQKLVYLVVRDLSKNGPCQFITRVDNVSIVF